MCGVLYFKGKSREHKELIVSLLRESRVRGLHAFGVSLRPSPEDDFQTMRTFDLPAAIDYIKANEFSELIGHCRYDTSGDWREINNNQPIVIGNSILAFNGVVRMSTKEEYEAEFQREYMTANDGEIVLRMFAEEDRRLMPLLEQPQVSFAGVAHINGRALAFRNQRRPLWRGMIGKNDQIVVSTLDIFRRAIRSLEDPRKYRAMIYQEIVPMEVTWL